MCTLVILRRIGHPWPLLVAANRDEMGDRPWKPPGRHWPELPRVVAGLDLLAGGTWLGLNDDGVIAAVLNRLNTLGPMPGLRSRGELPLIALAGRAARAAVNCILTLRPADYRPFNMLIADRHEAFWVRCRRTEANTEISQTIEIGEIPAGLSMITAYDCNDLKSPRIRRYLPAFESASVPDPDQHEWTSWTKLLASREHDPDAGPGGAMTVVTETGFGTVSASLLALHQDPQALANGIWLFAPGRPGEAPFQPVSLAPIANDADASLR